VVDCVKKQILIYYVSHTLVGAETNYPLIENFAYALVMSSQNYFEAYKIVVLTDQPLKNILQRLDASGRLLRWAVALSQYDLAFESQ